MATRIGVVGAAGRMGRMLLATIAATPGCVIAGSTNWLASRIDLYRPAARQTLSAFAVTALTTLAVRLRPI